MSKRTFADLETDVTLRIKLCDCELTAPLMAVQLFSSCAKALPSTEEWDLTGLRIDGQPVQCSVVEAWLRQLGQLTDQLLDGIQCTPEDSGPLTFERLYQLLAFSDAVGSRRGLLLACASQAKLDKLEMHLTVGEQQLQLTEMDQGSFRFSTVEDNAVYQECFAGGLHSVGSAVDAVGKASVVQQVEVQMEQLLFMAYKLDLVPLIDKLHAILRINTVADKFFFKEAATSFMFSTRVLGALGGSKHAQQLWSSSMHGEPCSFTPQSASCLLEPVVDDMDGYGRDPPEPLKFEAVLKRDFAGKAKGTRVYVKLDLFGDSTLALQDDSRLWQYDDYGHHYHVELRLTDVGKATKV